MSRDKLTYANEKGLALVIAIVFLAVLALLGTTAVLLSTTGTKTGGNYKSNEQALYVAEAGIHEALYRLSLFDDNTTPPPSGSMIAINGLSNNHAHISIDPNGLLENITDDDGNGLIDDIGDLNFNGAYDNRTWKTKIMLDTSEPSYTDTQTTIYTPTIQPSGTWLKYSSSTEDGTELTIEFKKDEQDIDGDGNTSEIVFYDVSLSTPYNVETTATPATGKPVLLIISTGRAEGSIREVQVEAVRQPITITPKAALVTQVAPLIDGTALISGFNHKGSTLYSDAPNNETQWVAVDWFKTNGVDNHGGPEEFDYPSGTFDANDDTHILLTGTTAAPNNEEELASEEKVPYGNRVKPTGHMPGVCAASGTVTTGGKAHIFGAGDDPTDPDGSPWKSEGCTPYPGPKEVLGIDQPTWDRILAKANATEADMDTAGKLTVPPKGVIYINNASGDELTINASTPGYDDGWGFMYVTGDVNFQSFRFKGMIYVDGDATIGMGFWLLGTIVIEGTATASVGEDIIFKGTFLYSKEALDKYVNQAMNFIILSWKEEF